MLDYSVPGRSPDSGKLYNPPPEAFEPGNVHWGTGVSVFGVGYGSTGPDFRLEGPFRGINFDVVSSGSEVTGPAALPISGWSGLVLEQYWRDQGATQVLVYTDKEAPTGGQDDTDYRMFGVWATNMFRPHGDRIGAFAHGGLPTGWDAASPSPLTGTATYGGTAMGYYLYNPTGTNRRDTGIFTADAELTADFDADTMSGALDTPRAKTGGGDLVSFDIMLESKSLSRLSRNARGIGHTRHVDSVGIENGTVKIHLGGQNYPDAGRWDAQLQGDDAGEIVGTFDARAVTWAARVSFVGSFAATKE